MPLIKIGYYEESMHVGGSVRYLLQIIDKLDKQRYLPCVFADRDCKWHEDLRANGIEVFTARGAFQQTSSGAPDNLLFSTPISSSYRSYKLKLPPNLAWWLGLLRDISRLYRLFKRHPVVLLHCNLSSSNYAPIAARIARIPHILTTLHILPSPDFNDQRGMYRYRLLERTSIRLSHHLISVCAKVRNRWVHLYGADPDKTDVIYNGIDTCHFVNKKSKIEARSNLELPAGSILIGSMGGLFRIKGYDYLIRAISIVKKSVPEVILAFAGDGNMKEYLVGLVDELDLKSSIVFIGTLSDVQPFLESLDIYVQPSLSEAFPYSLLEAALIGLPVIVTAIGGMPEVILDGITGLIVEAANVDSLANALIKLCLNPEMRQSMGLANNKRVISEFTSEIMTTRTMAVYERMLS